MKIALDLGADYVATGHYCRKDSVEKDGETIYQLKAGVDGNKDQSYFLCQLSQEQLAKALFPVGELTKPEVRKIAAEQDLVTADKKDSQGLCFIGKVRLPEFLQQQLAPKEGVIVEVAKDHIGYKVATPNFTNKEEELAHFATKFKYSLVDGKEVGKHQGAHYFTKGQRKGLAVGGTPEPLFVIDTDVKENIIYTGQGSDHPGLYRKALLVAPDEIHWIREDLRLAIGESMSLKARIRYRQPLQEATLYMTKEGLYVLFKEAQSAITEGQFAAFYKEDELIGSGVIS